MDFYIGRALCALALAVGAGCGGAQEAQTSSPTKLEPTATARPVAADSILLKRSDLPKKGWKTLPSTPEEAEDAEELFQQCTIGEGFEAEDVASADGFRREPAWAVVGSIVEVYRTADEVEKLRHAYAPQVSSCFRRLFGGSSEELVTGVLPEEVATVMRYNAKSDHHIALVTEGRIAMWVFWRVRGRLDRKILVRAVEAMRERAAAR